MAPARFRLVGRLVSELGCLITRLGGLVSRLGPRRRNAFGPLKPWKPLVAAVLAATICGSLSACADRLEPPTPRHHYQIEAMAQWAAKRSKPYGIPKRQLQGYAYAAYVVEKEHGCAIGWPTLAALGAVLTNHGQAGGAKVSPGGIPNKPLRRVAPTAEGKPEVPDTDAGSIDGDRTRDIPVGPMQLMPSRWEQFGASAEPGRKANPNQIDDAALTTALILCNGGDVTKPDGWVSALSQINPQKDFLLNVHNKAEEYSR